MERRPSLMHPLLENLTARVDSKFTLVALAPERHLLVLTAHHIVLDGWSVHRDVFEALNPFRVAAR